MLNWQRCRYACQLLLLCWHPAVLAAAVEKHLLFLHLIPCSLGCGASREASCSHNCSSSACSHQWPACTVAAPADAEGCPVLHVLLKCMPNTACAPMFAGCVRLFSLQLIRPAAATTAAAVAQPQTGTGGPAPSTSSPLSRLWRWSLALLLPSVPLLASRHCPQTFLVACIPCSISVTGAPVSPALSFSDRRQNWHVTVHT